MSDELGAYEAAALITTREKARGCCGDEAMDGHFCEYHQGYRDALLDIAVPLDGSDNGG